MNFRILEDLNPQEARIAQAEIHSIYHCMQQLQDPRRKQGKRYPIALVLTYVLLAKSAGETSLQAVSEWIRLRATWLQDVLPEAGPQFPCAATYSNVLRLIDPVHLTALLMDLLTKVRSQERQRGEQQHIAIDGKTLRGTLGHLAPDQCKMHQVCLYETQTGIVLTEQIVAEKANELSRIHEVVQPQWIQGRIVTADALYTQQSFCLQVKLTKGDYLLFAKGNQPTLQEDLRLFFQEPPLDCHDWRTASECTSGHGRLEMREIIASTELNAFLRSGWTGIAQVFCLRRRVCKPLVCTQQIIYGITSLSPDQASPNRLLELIRAHWAIENRLHYRRDVTFFEDHSQVRKGMAPRILAILNSFLLALFDWLGVSNVPRFMREVAAFPIKALRLFFLSLLRIK